MAPSQGDDPDPPEPDAVAPERLEIHADTLSDGIAGTKGSCIW
jgi:hypothetical protein